MKGAKGVKRRISVHKADLQLERAQAKAALLEKFLRDLGFDGSDEVEELIKNGRLAAEINGGDVGGD